MPDGHAGESSRSWLAGLFAFATLALTTAAPAAADIEDHLQFRWYRIELILFENPRDAAANEDVQARQVLLDAARLPRNARPLIEAERQEPEFAIGARLAPPEALPLVVSDLPPPVWFAGICAAESWQPTETAAATAFDPCLPRPDIDLEAEFRDDPSADLPSPEPPTAQEEVGELPEMPVDPAAPLIDEVHEREAVLEALRGYEDDLLSQSYRWHRQTPALADELRRLRRRFPVLTAGQWHQPVPPRDQAQPVLVQFGTVDDSRRYRLEGWFSVTLGRYVHFGAQLQYRLGDRAIALLSENRRMRTGEVHYFDHPALGILAHVEPLLPPEDLQRRFNELVE